MSEDLQLRPLVTADAPDVARIFFCAVHEGTRHVYTARQRRAWGGDAVDPESWRTRLTDTQGFVATLGDEPVGFMTYDATGHLDLAFVLPSMTRRGIGRSLLHAVEFAVREAGARQLTTEASLAARGFFARHGWDVEAEETVERGGVGLRRFRMRKTLAP